MIQHSESISNIAAALYKAQQTISTVTKSGNNTYQHYEYATLNDFINAVKTPLEEQGLVIVSSVDSVIREKDTLKKTTGEEYTDSFSVTQMSFKLIHAESGEWMQVSSIGEGVDRGDKASYKAITGGRKYGLALLFNLVTEDDAEKDESTDQRRNYTAVPMGAPPVQTVVHTYQNQPKRAANYLPTPQPGSGDAFSKLGITITQEANGKYINHVATVSGGRTLFDVLPPDIVTSCIRKKADAPDSSKGMFIPGGRASFNDKAFERFKFEVEQYAGTHIDLSQVSRETEDEINEIFSGGRPF